MREYSANGNIYVRPEEISHDDFIKELNDKFRVNGPSVVLGTVNPSLTGKR